jgi:hypothetical protein
MCFGKKQAYLFLKHICLFGFWSSFTLGEAATGNLYRVLNPIKVCKLQRPDEFKPTCMPKESRFVGEKWL